MSFGRSLFSKYEKQLLDANTKTGLNALKTATKIVVYEAVEARGKFIGHKIADKIIKPKPVSARNVEEIIIPLEQR